MDNCNHLHIKYLRETAINNLCTKWRVLVIFSHIHCRRKIIYIIDIPFQISEKGYENVLLNKSN